jgi:hypothetical protein
MFNVRLLSGVVRKASQGVARRGLDNLAKVTEERVGV